VALSLTKPSGKNERRLGFYINPVQEALGKRFNVESQTFSIIRS